MGEKVVITSSLPGAVSLSVFTPGIDDGSGHRYPARGPGVIVPGIGSPGAKIENGVAVSEVDSEFWSAWLEQNKDNAWLAGAIVAKKPE